MESIGWNALEVDGNDMEQIVNKTETAINTHGAPTVIIADTLKGKGISLWSTIRLACRNVSARTVPKGHG